ncbi:response regulator [Marinomonas algicola]|uniref:response regulator n=1 Tax=Marinomonas algicola TaxID=2773454 RepID=UPI00174C1F88|nr:two-component system response regulator [Marinomonas algicola]
MSTNKPTVLIVDDESINISILMSFLKTDYRIIAAKNGHQALDRLTDAIPPDIILLDVVMPEMDGYEVCKKIKDNPVTQHIPVIFISSKNNHIDETNGFEMGAADYITKPISPPIVLSRIKTHLNLARVRQLLVSQNHLLEETIKQRTKELTQTQDITILALATLAETRDNETGNHIRRTQNYVKALAIELAKNPKHNEFLTPENIDLLFKSAPLHDIGKVGIPDNILLKPGKLSTDEFHIMKDHASLGNEALSKAEQLLGNGNISFLRFAREIASGHHEKWDGSGYPKGLSGEEIPFSARLMAVADVYDALISKRVYKPAFTHSKAVSIIIEGSGKHFDPEIVNAFLKIEKQFVDIAKCFSDGDQV